MERLIDNFGRHIHYLRISVTDRCNLRCVYCMPPYGVAQKDPREILTFEEIHSIAALMVPLGVNKIRITGGEPLVRKNIVRLIVSLSAIPSLDDLSLTTNGLLLATYAAELKKAGLQRINVSLDTLDSAKFKRTTRGGALQEVVEGITEAKRQGFFVKLNVVVMQGINADEILDFVRFGMERGIIVRFIEYMPKGGKGFWEPEKFISMDEARKKINLLGTLVPAKGIKGSGPARYVRLRGNAVPIGFIPAISCKFCVHCNRLRLTSSGMLLPCLASEEGFDLKRLLRQDKKEAVADLIRHAVRAKPVEHNFSLSYHGQYSMSQIGG